MISTNFRFKPSDDTAFDVCADPPPAAKKTPPVSAKAAPAEAAPAPAGAAKG